MSTNKEQQETSTEIQYNGIFVSKTEKFESYLIKLKEQFDAFDRNVLALDSRIKHVNEHKKEIFAVFNKHFSEIWKIVGGFSKIEYSYHQKYYQKKLLPLLSSPPLNQRIYEKPLGYPGDFIMMNYYYKDSYEGSSSFEMLLHRYTLELPVARAHINRKKYFKEKLKELLKNGREIRITSLGCGSAKEIIEFIQENRTGKKFIINLVDSEIQALEQIKNSLSQLVVVEKPRINYINLNILDLIRRKNCYALLQNQDFIYAAGLFDYFGDKLAKSVLNSVYSLLVQGGELIIVNVAKKHQSQTYMEMLGEWYLNLRDKDNLLSLTKDVNNAKISVSADPENGMNYYLILKKLT